MYNMAHEGFILQCVIAKLSCSIDESLQYLQLRVNISFSCLIPFLLFCLINFPCQDSDNVNTHFICFSCVDGTFSLSLSLHHLGIQQNENEREI